MQNDYACHSSKSFLRGFSLGKVHSLVPSVSSIMLKNSVFPSVSKMSEKAYTVLCLCTHWRIIKRSICHVPVPRKTSMIGLSLFLISKTMYLVLNLIGNKNIQKVSINEWTSSLCSLVHSTYLFNSLINLHMPFLIWHVVFSRAMPFSFIWCLAVLCLSWTFVVQVVCSLVHPTCLFNASTNSHILFLVCYVVLPSHIHSFDTLLFCASIELSWFRS